MMEVNFNTMVNIITGGEPFRITGNRKVVPKIPGYCQGGDKGEWGGRGGWSSGQRCGGRLGS